MKKGVEKNMTFLGYKVKKIHFFSGSLNVGLLFNKSQ